MSKITVEHLGRGACVYIRQSTADQIRFNQESRRRQYALQDRARALGWSEVTVIDDDLGRSGGGIVRPGFERLLASVCRGAVGAVFAIEASRLARNGRDWHTLLDFCGLVGTLIVDEDGVYDPRHPNDRLLLGMKGTLSEMELSLLRQRSQEALKLKARRGELFTSVPIGYRRVGLDRIEKDPDRRVQEALDLVFRKFAEFHSIRQVHVWLLQEGLDLPRIEYRDGERSVVWKAPRYSMVLRLLTNPIYAGAYAYGRSGSSVRIEQGRKAVRRGIAKARTDWDVLLPAHHEGYISWETYEHYQRVIAGNTNRRGGAVRGPLRKGEALLAGLLRCGHCGRKLHVAYTGKRGSAARYHCCSRFHNEGPQAQCISFGALRVDAAIAEVVLRVLQPEGLRAALAAADSRATDDSERQRQLRLAAEQTRFEAEHAKRQYDRVDPDNRLVAAELERRWNDRLTALHQIEERLQAATKAVRVLTDEERSVLLALGADVEHAWHHPAASPESRKRILRAVITEVVVQLDASTLTLTVHWQGGDHTQVVVGKNKTGQHRWTTPAEVQDLIRVLARQTADRNIAAILNRSGKRTAHGHTWTEGRVRSFRGDHGIAVYHEGERQARHEVTLEEAAGILGIRPMAVRRLIVDGVLPAAQLCRGAPWIIAKAALDQPQVQQALRVRRRRPVTNNALQESLALSAS